MGRDLRRGEEPDLARMAALWKDEYAEALAALATCRERSRGLEEALRDESHNRASAARAALRYGEAAQEALQILDDDGDPITARRVLEAALSTAPEPVGEATDNDC